MLNTSFYQAYRYVEVIHLILVSKKRKFAKILPGLGTNQEWQSKSGRTNRPKTETKPREVTQGPVNGRYKQVYDQLLENKSWGVVSKKK
jgi:hypothetical protein